MYYSHLLYCLFHNDVNADFDDIKQLWRPIKYQGRGWYSMDDDGIYQPGKFATYSRIKIR